MPGILRSFSAVFLLSATLLSIGSTERATASDNISLKAGAAAVDITPQKYPVSMTGSFWDRKALGAHDKLHARGLVLDDGRTRLAIVVCDSCLISREIYDEAKRIASKKTGIPTSRMTMSATHTHTAPTAVALADCTPDPDYVRFLTDRIAAAVDQANAHLAPAQLAWGVGEEPDEVSCRRWKKKPGTIPPNPFGKIDKVQTNAARGSADLVEPAAPTDPQVTVLSVRSADGQPLALLASYSLHYVGGIPAGQVSADYFGEFARQTAAKLDVGEKSPFVGILANGSSGDINNYNFRNPRPPAQPFQQIKVVADKVSAAALSAVKQAKYRGDVSLAMVEREIELGVRKPSAEDLEYANDLLAKRDPERRMTLPEVYARETVRLSEHPGRVKIKLQALRIGKLAIAAIPCETFVQIGLEIKKRSPLQPTCVIGLANGYNGYLPTPEQHALGGYETWRCGWSNLEVNASRKITEEMVEMLKEVAK